MPTILLPLLLVLLVGFMFFGTRKQRRTMQQQQDMQKSLEPGDRVMTTSGLYGTIVGTSDDTIDIEIAEGMTTTWLRAAVREKVADEVPEVEELEDDAELTEGDEVAEDEATEESSELVAEEEAESAETDEATEESANTADKATANKAN